MLIMKNNRATVTGWVANLRAKSKLVYFQIRKEKSFPLL